MCERDLKTEPQQDYDSSSDVKDDPDAIENKSLKLSDPPPVKREVPVRHETINMYMYYKIHTCT